MFFDVYKDLCTQKGKTPNGVAKELGIASSSVTQWKNGSTPRPDVLQKIADYFDVSVEYLLTGEEKTPALNEGEQIPGYSRLTPENQEFVRKQVALLLAEQRGG